MWHFTASRLVAQVGGNELIATSQSGIGHENHVGQARLGPDEPDIQTELLSKKLIEAFPTCSRISP